MIEWAVFTVLTLIMLALAMTFVLFWRGVNQMQGELRAELAQCEQRVDELQRQLLELAQLVSVPAVIHSAPTAGAGSEPVFGYDMAVRLATIGASESELIKACGMTQEEAALVARLHGGRLETPIAQPRESKDAAP